MSRQETKTVFKVEIGRDSYIGKVVWDWEVESEHKTKSDADWMCQYHRLVKGRHARVSEVHTQTTIHQ